MRSPTSNASEHSSGASVGASERGDELSGDVDGEQVGGGSGAVRVASVLYRLSWSDATRQRRDRPRCGAGRCGWPDGFLGGGFGGGGSDGYYEDSDSEPAAGATLDDDAAIGSARWPMGQCAVVGAPRGPRDELLRAPLWRPTITHTIESVNAGAAAQH